MADPKETGYAPLKRSLSSGLGAVGDILGRISTSIRPSSGPSAVEVANKAIDKRNEQINKSNPVVASHEDYFTKYLPYARKYEQQTGIPAEVFLAIGASESNWGATGTIFGVKGTGTAGTKSYDTWEMFDGKRVNVKDNFALYNNPDEAFQAFLDLVSKGRYANSWKQFQSDGNWQSFLGNINKAGYASDTQWSGKIASIASQISNGKLSSTVTPTGVGASDTGQPRIAKTGSFNKDFIALSDEYDRIEAELSHPKYHTVDELTGKQTLTPEGQALDDRAAAIDKQLSILVEARKNGVYNTGEDAAKAYLDSEKLKSGEAARAYTDYSNRVSDVVALENVPLTRDAAISTARNKVTQSGIDLGKNISAGISNPSSAREMLLNPKYIDKGTDFQPIANSIKATLPNEAPAYRPMSDASMAPLPTGDAQLRVPFTLSSDNTSQPQEQVQPTLTLEEQQALAEIRNGGLA